MRVWKVAVAAATITLTAMSSGACAGGAPAADDTGPVEGTNAQDSPQTLVLELIRLREEGKPEQAAQYFISHDIKVPDVESMTEVDASILCTSNSAECDSSYSDYVSGKECAGTTLEEAEAAGVELSNQGRVARIKGTSHTGYNCGFEVREVGGKWWITSG